MPDLTRTFTGAELEAIGVPHRCPGPDDPNPHGRAVELHREHVTNRRNVSVHELVFRAPDDGKAYRVRYQEGLTGALSDLAPFQFDPVTATEMVGRQATITQWLPAEAALAGAGADPVTAPESPSALLHRAADRLEELAGAVVADDATRLDLPWHIERCANEEAGDCPCIIAQAENGEGGAPPTAMFYVADAETSELAAYIAVVDPPTGQAFAAMLRAAAVMAKGLAEAGDVTVIRAGMDTARKILGEA